jgi:hypothetical protein
MTKHHATSIALLLLTMFIAVPSAHASPACTCDRGPEIVDYAHSPTNVRVLVTKADVTSAPTFAPQIAFHQAPAGDDAGHVWIVPDAELAPNTDYVLSFAGGGEIDIHTSSGHDATPPTLTSVSGGQGGFEGACPAQISATIIPAGVGDDAASMPWLRLTIDGADGHHVVIVPTSEPEIGHLIDESCGNAAWAHEGTYALRASAIDLAGNESAPIGPSNVELTRVKGRGGCLCDGAGVGGSGVEALGIASVIAGMIASRRRRRRSLV